jgi:Xaa-Pro aminopeptidase
VEFLSLARSIANNSRYSAGARKLAETLEKNGSSLVGIQQNLVDLVWGKDRPSRPREKVRAHPVKYAGKPFQEKVAELRKELETKKKAGFVICMVNLLSISTAR